jgi:hypothetical protein
VKWVAQASAEQRKGRAGRTGPGHCYRYVRVCMHVLSGIRRLLRWKEAAEVTLSFLLSFQYHLFLSTPVRRLSPHFFILYLSSTFRLYSSAFYDQHMVPFQPPEIVTTPLEDLLLQVPAAHILSYPFYLCFILFYLSAAYLSFTVFVCDRCGRWVYLRWRTSPFPQLLHQHL